MLKKLMLLCVLGLTLNTLAEEKVVWCPKDSIGKNKTWVKGATAEVKDNALVIKFTGAEWAGVGLNWQGYWPKDSGVKIADYTNLVISLKVSGKADSLSLTLKDNKHKVSGNVYVKKYCMGEQLPIAFTSISIPIKDFLTEKSKLESSVIWEIMFGTWSKEEKDVTVTVDKIGFSK